MSVAASTNRSMLRKSSSQSLTRKPFRFFKPWFESVLVYTEVALTSNILAFFGSLLPGYSLCSKRLQIFWKVLWVFNVGK